MPIIRRISYLRADAAGEVLGIAIGVIVAPYVVGELVGRGRDHLADGAEILHVIVASTDAGLGAREAQAGALLWRRAARAAAVRRCLLRRCRSRSRRRGLSCAAAAAEQETAAGAAIDKPRLGEFAIAGGSAAIEAKLFAQRIRIAAGAVIDYDAGAGCGCDAASLLVTRSLLLRQLQLLMLLQFLLLLVGEQKMLLLLLLLSQFTLARRRRLLMRRRRRLRCAAAAAELLWCPPQIEMFQRGLRRS